MGTVNVILGDGKKLNLVLGQQLENAVTAVVFDFSAWQTEFGSGTLGLSVQRHGDTQPYAVVPTVSGTNATWNITELDTAYKGVGEVQVTYTVGSVVKKSTVYKFTVYRSLGENGEYPSPGQTWQEEIEDELADVKQDLEGLSLGINPEDDLIYIYLNGVPIGDGVDGGGTGTRYTVSWQLSNATSTSHIASIAEEKPLTATLTANNSLVLTTVIITMGGTDITGTAYNPSTGQISIASVTGNVVIYAEATDGVVVFSADFSGEHPLSTQFYTWDGRVYDGAIYDSLSNIDCSDGVVDLTSVYDSVNSRWIKQMLTTGGLFESDNFTLTFKAMFDSTAGSWQNVISYGTGIHWTNGIYSDGIKWPAGGEIDAFEQAGGYSANPNTFHPCFHYGSGTNSGYPHTHDYLHMTQNALSLPVDEWADYKYILQNGVATLYVNDTQVAQGDGSNLTVNNNYLWNYKPFLKPQAFYIDGSCASGSGSIDTSNEYHFYVKDFKIITESKQNTPCTALSIYPQMWTSGTTLVFPTNAEIYFDRVYTPSNTSNKACTWASSNTSVATVCQGYVKTLSEGTCTITATCGNASDSYILTVSNSLTNIPCAGVIVDTNLLQLVEYGSVDLSEEIFKYPKFTTENVVLVSSDSSIATIDGTTVRGVGLGQATITIRCGNATTTVPVSVSSGIIFDSNIQMGRTGQDFEQAIDYDFTQTYSFQYTFDSHTPEQTSSVPNCTVGPTKANDAQRNGDILYKGSESQWKYVISGGEYAFSPSVGDVLTIVHNFITEKTNVYLNDTVLKSNQSAGKAYFTDTAKIVVGGDNANMTVAPIHIKIAIGDLHPTS